MDWTCDIRGLALVGPLPLFYAICFLLARVIEMAEDLKGSE